MFTHHHRVINVSTAGYYIREFAYHVGAGNVLRDKRFESSKELVGRPWSKFISTQVHDSGV
jgi:hypothetical protein